jgi:hypothetical protein
VQSNEGTAVCSRATARQAWEGTLASVARKQTAMHCGSLTPLLPERQQCVQLKCDSKGGERLHHR